ncbi:unnamed protein product (macronuclear) [Paramecium tetraurelia]|uniref:Uncharacterized protein n=1 Tax=Paramecium tetraurelia TaxID=5888 RepID=A0BAZ5_PARTE|nr:uncharacterized protein GSPATT00000147001 [Paramecium tetraurelia]CAK55712.1 unnamed protein product [Paramecium tetraurelia]
MRKIQNLRIIVIQLINKWNFSAILIFYQEALIQS